MDWLFDLIIGHAPALVIDWVFRLVPQNWLINYCQRVKSQKGEIGIRVIKLSNKVVVKYGSSMNPDTQKWAYKRADPSIVRIPRVYHYFEDGSDPSWPDLGYLFMEYIPGRSLEELELEEVMGGMAKRLANIVTHLQEINTDGLAPGPIGGGMSQGHLWGENGTRTVFHSVNDLNHWINKRLKLLNKSIDLTPYPLVLCHLDLSRRNIILGDDNSLCLIDWGYAGLFPRFYEPTAIPCYVDDPVYYKGLLEAVRDVMVLTDDEKHCMELVMRCRAGSLRYVFEPHPDDTKLLDLSSRPRPPPLPSQVRRR